MRTLGYALLAGVVAVAACATGLCRRPRVGVAARTPARARARPPNTVRCRAKPAESPAAISGEPAAVVVGELGRKLVLRCLAYGYPRPEITWYRGERGPMVPFFSQQYEARGNLLRIRSLDTDSVGEYACHAYNGVGSPATWKVVVKAEMPPGYNGDNPYLVAHDEEQATRGPPASPAEPPPPPPLPEEPPLFTGEAGTVRTSPVVVTHIVAESTTFGVGSELSLLCEVDGYPLPEVVWAKDGVRLAPGGRVQISEAHRLTIASLTAEDAGRYTCSARNEYSAHQDTVSVNVEGLSIPETCTDNPFFANCKLIVRSKFCKHVYYSNFCCRSCMEAGQLRPDEAPTASIAAWRRK
ncbi:Papilin [Eumeta japonica]|uniref:Hemolin n=1 Tax=Eumeta variegata TaxID=151549 RepID=A0A4C1X7L6_EUMVA|nr:Papilin [Eumeta japonica]